MNNEIKIWGGFATVAIIFVCAFVVFKLAEQTQSMSNLQLVGSECKLAKNEEKCQKLLDFGVAPSMYLKDSAYQTEIDKKAIEILESAPIYARDVALYTLDKAGNSSVKLTVKVLKKIQEVSESK
tara:strand:+ start:551 stop:925 length:375 start_codon:yes stop_codon:yes gene_type:complete